MKTMQDVQELFVDNSTKNVLEKILFSVQRIAETIIQLGKSGDNLGESLALVQNVENKFSREGIGVKFAKNQTIASIIKKKKNPGYSQIKTISEILSGEVRDDNKEGIEELSLEDVYCFKYGPKYSLVT